MAWQERAACAGFTTDWWFSSDQTDKAKAEAVCETCPVKDECLAFQLSFEPWQRAGIFGGVDFGSGAPRRVNVRTPQRRVWEREHHATNRDRINARKRRAKAMSRALETPQEREVRLQKQRQQEARRGPRSHKKSLDSNQLERVG